MKILITGIGGYLGSQLANALITEHEISGTIRYSSKLARVNNKEKMTFIDVEKTDWIEQVKKLKPDIVINTATSYGRNSELLSSMIDANIVFPQKILECMEVDTVFINCGTSLPPSVSLYSLTKNQFVELAKKHCRSNRVKFVNLRLEHFFGAGDDITKFTSYIIHQCLANRPLELTEGTQMRDFIYIEDVISAFDFILASLHQLDLFEEIDIGSGLAIKVRDFVELVASITSSTSKIKFGAIPIRDNELMYSCANILKLKELGWAVKYSLDEAIHNIVETEQFMK
ncbi:NAD-dependent epimerase/dehydratase family protein [Aeromonas veronii]